MASSFFSAVKSQITRHGIRRSSSLLLSQASPRIPNWTNYALLVSLAGGGSLLVYADADSSIEPGTTEAFNKHSSKKKLVVLGTGWAGTSLLRNVDSTKYNVEVVSPRNYFVFTPLLPSVTCGTVEARSISEPIRRIIENKNEQVRYWEAECLHIDPKEKKIVCQSNTDVTIKGKEKFVLEYDYLVIAVGAKANTFNTPGVSEYCHFLKEIEDAQKIRTSIVDCFERASLPHLTDEDRQRILHFIIVGGGPTGVEFAAELHDYVYEDLIKLYPSVKNFVKITVIQSGDHILNTFDQRISNFAEQKFQRDGVEIKTGYRVTGVTEDSIQMKCKQSKDTESVSYGMIVWSTGIGTIPIVSEFMKKIGQNDRRVLATDEWLRVKGCDDVFALGDCATIDQRKIMEDISYIFKRADKDNSGTLTVEEFLDVLSDIRERYPQLDLYMKRNHMKDVKKLIEIAEENVSGEKIELNIEQFKRAFSQVDSQMKTLPATAQVAAQQGAYLANCLNNFEKRRAEPEGPMHARGPGRHIFHPFRYKHFGQFAPLGGEQAAAELPGDWVSIGHSTQWLWYSVYATKQVSWRTRALVMFDWTKRFVFGRDSSRM